MDLTKELETFQILLEEVKNNPELMMKYAIGAAIVLIILLMSMVFSQIVGSLKNRLFSEEVNNLDNIKKIHKLTREVKVYDARIERNKEKLKHYDILEKNILKKDDEIRKLEKDKRDIIKEREHMESKHRSLQKDYEKSLTEIKAIKRRNEELINGKRIKSR